MARRTIHFKVAITIRDYTKAERDEESLEKEECEDMAESADADDIAEALAYHLKEEADEILAGSNVLVKVTAVTAKPES